MIVRVRRTCLDPGGFALPLTLFVLTIVGLLTAALAGATTAQLGVGRLADWDRRALYAAEAGVEHQVFALKADRGAGPVGPVSMGGSPLEARYQVVSLVPSAPGGVCSAEPGADESWWEVTSLGQVWQGSVRVHEREVRALLGIRYDTPSPQVRICRWH